jgi:hypothetical protein
MGFLLSLVCHFCQQLFSFTAVKGYEFQTFVGNCFTKFPKPEIHGVALEDLQLYYHRYAPFG